MRPFSCKLHYTNWPGKDWKGELLYSGGTASVNSISGLFSNGALIILRTFRNQGSFHYLWSMPCITLKSATMKFTWLFFCLFLLANVVVGGRFNQDLTSSWTDSPLLGLFFCIVVGTKTNRRWNWNELYMDEIDVFFCFFLPKNISCWRLTLLKLEIQQRYILRVYV